MSSDQVVQECLVPVLPYWDSRSWVVLRLSTLGLSLVGWLKEPLVGQVWVGVLCVGSTLAGWLELKQMQARGVPGCFLPGPPW